MPGIRIKIDRYTRDDFPGWVECSLVDAAGTVHLFEEKVPVVTLENLDARSTYPRGGAIDCTILGARRSADGQEVVLVDTDRPWGIESKTGRTQFEVSRDQVLELDEGAG